MVVKMSNTSNTYLMHYGVKGMRWGVRHDPVRSSRTRQRYSPQEKQRHGKTVVSGSGKRSKLKNDDRKRKIIRGVLIGTAALSAAAVVKLEKRKMGLMASDRILKAGTTIQNIAPAERSFNTPFYAVSSKKDRLYYLKNFTKAPTKRDPVGRNVATILKNEKDVNIAGKNAMDAAYKRAYGNHPIKREIFYRRLGALKPHQKAKFTNELVKAGYGGHKDINDMQWVFGGNTPTVFFGNKSGFTKDHSAVVNVKKAKKIKVLTEVGERSLKAGGAVALGTGSAYGLYKTTEKNVRRKASDRKNKKR